MPELPEVYTIVKDLDTHISDHRIDKVAIAKGYKVLPDKKTFLEGVLGQKIVGVERIAKNIIIKLESGNGILFHLAMTGKLLIRPTTHGEDMWVKVVFLIRKFASESHLRFSDMRMFGKAQLVDPAEIEELVKSVGPEPLEETLTPGKFLDLIKSRRTNIKNVLLDQKVISGLGNIYATEALFLAGIHPKTPTSDVAPEMAEKLLEATRKILKEAIENRGSTLPDKMYVDAFGREGNQQKHFRVYLQRKCGKCKGDISYIKLNNRGTYFCPMCQTFGSQKALL